jgi:hypothetical protein
MISLQPDAPWRDTYDVTAQAIERAANGTLEGEAELVALAWFESRFQPDAEGDSKSSFGLYQIAPGTCGCSKDELINPESASRIAVRLIKVSRSICRDYPNEERLGWYAQGGNTCDSERGRRLSAHRIAKAKRLIATWRRQYNEEKEKSNGS